jgi:predicted amidohydrolase YtcJ
VSHYRNLIPPAHRISTPSVRNWDTKEQALAAVRDIVAKYDPSKPWIALNGLIRKELKVGAGTVDMNPLTKVQLSITKGDLDQISPNRPLVIALHGKYAGVANSKAIEALQQVYGPDLSGIEKDARGNPTGRINGPVAMHVIAVEFIPEIPAEHLATVYKKELDEHLAPFGITTFSTRLDSPEIRGYMLLDIRGEMPLRLAYGHDIGRFNPFFERDMRRAMEVVQGFGSDKIWLSGITVGHPDSQPGASVCSTFT